MTGDTALRRGSNVKGAHRSGRRRPPYDETHPRWTGLLWRAALLPMLVTLPLSNLPLSADHRFNVFKYGGDLAREPWRIVEPIRDVPRYLGAGNFRPLGRMVERGQDYLTFEAMIAFDLPATVTLRLISMIFVGLVGVSVVLLAETLTSSGRILQKPPSAVAHISVLALPTMMAATRVSSVVLFTSLYFASAAVVLLVATAAARRAWFDQEKAGISVLLLSAFVGAGLAAFNEITYLAPPLIVLTVFARGTFTLGLSPLALLRTKAAKTAIASCIGFAAVFVPVRFLIARACADGECYATSDINMSADAVEALGHRLLSANPIAVWSATASSARGWPLLKNGVNITLLLLIVVLVVLTWRHLRRSALPGAGGVWALATAGLGLLILSNTMMALSVSVQNRVSAGSWPIGNGFRDLPVVAASVALLTAAVALGGALLSTQKRAGTESVLAVVTTLLGSAILVAAYLNLEYVTDQRGAPETELFDRISLAMLHLDDEGDDERCGLLAEFADTHPNRTDWQQRLEEAVDSAADASVGRPFCSGKVE